MQHAYSITTGLAPHPLLYHDRGYEPPAESPTACRGPTALIEVDGEEPLEYGPIEVLAAVLAGVDGDVETGQLPPVISRGARRPASKGRGRFPTWRPPYGASRTLGRVALGGEDTRRTVVQTELCLIFRMAPRPLRD